MTSMRQRAAIGSRWRRRRDKTVWVVRQSHRADRVALLEPETPCAIKRAYVPFERLRVLYEQLREGSE